MISSLYKLFRITKSKKYIFLYFFLIFVAIFSELLTFNVISQLLDRVISDTTVKIYLLESREQVEISLFVTVVICIISTGLRAIQLLALSIIPQKIGFDLNRMITEKYLKLTNSAQLNWNNTEFMADITVKTNAIVYSTISPILMTFGAILTIISMCGYLLYIDIFNTLMIMFGFIAYYSGVYVLVSKKINQIATKLNTTQNEINKIALDLSLLQRMAKFYFEISSLVSSYLQNEYENRKVRVLINFISQLPKLIIELCIFILIVGFASSTFEYQVSSIYLINLGLVAQRVFPMVQQIFSNITIIKSNSEILASILNHLCLPSRTVSYETKSTSDWKFIKVKIFSPKNDTHDFILQNGFKYFVSGPTGSGKSTLLSVVSGDKSGISGELYIDDVKMSDASITDHYRNTSYYAQQEAVPSISLIEFFSGKVDFKQSDIDKLTLLLAKVGLEKRLITRTNWWMESIPSASRFSGGELQRMRIVQALFKDSSLYVFDEPTSALDAATEKLVLDFIFSYLEQKTVVIVSHNVKVRQYCDETIEL